MGNLYRVLNKNITRKNKWEICAYTALLRLKHLSSKFCISPGNTEREMGIPPDALPCRPILPLPFHVPSCVVQHTTNTHLLKCSQLERNGSMAQLSSGCCHALKTDPACAEKNYIF